MLHTECVFVRERVFLSGNYNSLQFIPLVCKITVILKMTKWLILQVFSLFFFNFLLFRWKTFGLLSLWWSCWGSVFNFPDCSCESASIQMICVTLLSSLCCSHPLTGNRCFVRCHQIALSFFNQNRFLGSLKQMCSHVSLPLTHLYCWFHLWRNASGIRPFSFIKAAALK